MPYRQKVRESRYARADKVLQRHDGLHVGERRPAPMGDEPAREDDIDREPLVFEEDELEEDRADEDDQRDDDDGTHL